MNANSPDRPTPKARRPHRMTPARQQALRKARLASARKRRERARERRREWHRQEGYWFFHRWGLYAVPFTRTIRRLGESVSGFITLLSLAERWLVRRRQEPEDRSQRSPAGGLALEDASARQSLTPNPELLSPGVEPLIPSPQLLTAGFSQIAAKVARALAQVLWLRPRVLRERARDRSVRLEARLRTVAELQGVLHGAAGPEEQARQTAEMRQTLSAETLSEYKKMRILGIDPGDLWPRRLAWRIALRLREVLEDGFDRERDLAAIRRRAAWLLEVYQLAAEISSGDAAPQSSDLGGVGPTLGSAGVSADPWAAEEARVRKELEAIERLDTRLKLVLAGEEHEAGLTSERARALLPALDERRRQARARRRKLRRLRLVEQTSAESLGNPFVRPRQVRRRLAGEVRRKRPRVSDAGAAASAEAEARAEADARFRQELQEFRDRHPELRERERQEAAERGLTLEEWRRRQLAESQPQPVGVRRYWDRALGWCAEIRQGVQRYAVRLSEMSGGREEWGWPVVRELEVRAEVEARRGRQGGTGATHKIRSEASVATGRDEQDSKSPGSVILSGVPALLSSSGEEVQVGLREESRSDAESVQSEMLRCAQHDNQGTSGLEETSAAGEAVGGPGSGFTYAELKRLLGEAFGLAPGWAIEWRYTPPNSAQAAAWYEIAPPRRPAPRRVIDRRLERVARLLWLMLETDRRRADEEAARLQQILSAARPGEFEPTAQALAALEAEDREAEFEAAERLARLSEALGRLLAAMYDGYREFGRLAADPVWFDAERKRMLRQDLGLEPLPADFEPPEPPAEFVEHRRKFLARLKDLCAVRREAWSDASLCFDDS